MAIYDDQWFEVWYSEGTEYQPHYLLLVSPNPKNKKEIIIYDLIKNNEIIYRSKNYEEISNWLNEDEFQLVEGRTFPDYGW